MNAQSLRRSPASVVWLAAVLLAFLAAGPSLAVKPVKPVKPVAEASSTPVLAGESIHAPRQLLDRSTFQAVPDPRANGHIFAVTLDGLLRSEDGGTTWDPIGTGLAINEVSARYARVAFDPVQPDVLYETPGGIGGPVYRSMDGGDTWQPASAGLPLDITFAVAGDTAHGSVLTAVASGIDPGVFRSLDHGETWIRAGQVGPIPEGNIFSPHLLVVQRDDPSSLYLAGTVTIPSSGPCGAACASDHLFRSLDGGATWSRLDAAPFPVPDVLEIDGRQPATLYAALNGYGGSNGTIYRSTDRGESWEVASERRAVDLTVDPRRKGGLYRATFSVGLYHSADLGTTWQRLAPDFASIGLRQLAYLAAPAGSTGRDVLYVTGQKGLWALDLTPPVPSGPSFVTPEIPGFRVWVRISSADGASLPVRAEHDCLPETLCVSGSVPGRSELFVRIVGPKPNGKLWPTLVRFTTSRVEVWIEQVAGGQVEYYMLPAARPGVDELNGLFDRQGFNP